jgi:hypothetical protein
MVVLTQHRRPGVVGLHIGAGNVREYFPRDVETVELELDHLCILCTLEPSFWQDRPEIHDLRLSSWLEAKRNSGKLGAQPAPVAMIPNGKCSFRVQPVSKEELGQADRSEIGPPGVTYFSPTVSPIALLDRRKHTVPRNPERRKVARIKTDDRQRDERPAAAAGD